MMPWFVIGFAFGAAVVAVAWLVHARTARSADASMREAFAAAAAEALDTNARRLTELSGATLQAKKELIDQSITVVNQRLEQVRTFLQQTESDRQKHYGQLSERLAALSASTESLRGALAGSKRIGEWGERMTEDVLRLAGMQEGVNYRKQSAGDAESGKPDFSFLLPNELVVNMDVKFPLQKSLDYLDADEPARKAKGEQFIAAVRGHVRQVARRGYIDPAGGTLDYAIVFIPNEQVYSLALELDHDLMDESLRQRIVLAGPLTLYALLAVIRQAAENANLMRTADEVIQLLADIEKQWQRYKDSMDKMGRRIEDARTEYENLVTTRTRAMDRPLAKIEDLRTARGLPAAAEANPAGNDD